MKWQLLLVLFLVHLSLSQLSKSRESQIEQASQNIAQKIHKLFKDYTKYDELAKEFEALLTSKKAEVRSLNVSEVSEDFKQKLRNFLLSKISSVKNIKQRAKQLYENHSHDHNIKKFPYLNDKLLPVDSVRPEPTFFLGVNVNLNRSHIQLPTNIYEYNKTILNEVKWTKELDEVFLENFNRTPTLLWQYFGSENGLLRSFPGYRQDPTVNDLFDCRRRLWYSQAIQSPKDVLLLLDLSGSMTGNHFTIAKLAVKSLIDTLQQDDFFNVLTFQENVNYIFSCVTNLTQATSKHKTLVKDAVDLLPRPKGESDPIKALQTAFSILNAPNRNHMTSSKCAKVIFFISDGIETSSSIQDTVKRLNKKKDVVIFSYLIGPSERNSKPMQKIACENNGEMYKLPTVGNVWNRVLKYHHVLSRSIAETNEDLFVFTTLYLDANGLGMMTTLSTGVFSQDSTNNSILLGVAGVDITINQLTQRYPTRKLGPFGHAFSINNNGLFLIHSRFRDQTGYLPDPATVYLNELEYTTNKSKSLELKAAMIDRNTGCMDAELDWLFMSNNKRVVRYNTTYCYSPIEDTAFSSGVSVPYANKEYLLAYPPGRNKDLMESIDSLNGGSHTYVQVANWLVCNIQAAAKQDQPAILTFFPTAEELRLFLQNFYNQHQVNFDQVPSNCEKDELLNLLLSAKTIMNFRNNYWDQTKTKDEKIDSLYAISTSGYMLYENFHHVNDSVYNRDIFTEERYAHPASFHARTLGTPLVATTPMKEKQNDIDSTNTVSLGRAITVSDGKVLVGVVGMDLSVSILKRMLLDATNVFDTDCKEGRCVVHACRDTDNLQCYLLDENAYVVVSNQRDAEHGKFFGYVSGLLMKEFERKNIYQRSEFLDNQEQCVKILYPSSSASNLKTFFNNCWRLFVFFANSIFFFVSLLSNAFVSQVKGGDLFEAKNESCSKSIIIHTLQNQTLKHLGVLPCDGSGCTQNYAVQTVQDTNLVLVMTSDNCIGKSCSKYLCSNEPERLVPNRICDETENYRRASPICYETKTYNDHCNAARSYISACLNIYLTVFLSLLLTELLSVYF